MTTRFDIITAARSMLGAPYQAQGRGTEAVPGFDCGGVLTVMGHRTGISAFDILGYSPNPDGETFERLLNEHLDPIEDFREAKLGDVLACDFGDGIQHVMIISSIHSRRRDWHQFKVVHATRKNGVHEGVPELLYYRNIVRAYSVARYVED